MALQLTLRTAAIAWPFVFRDGDLPDAGEAESNKKLSGRSVAEMGMAIQCGDQSPTPAAWPGSAFYPRNV